MSKEKKVGLVGRMNKELIRGALVSDQFVFQRRSQKLTEGSVYKIKRDWVRYIGMVSGKTKFELLFK